MIPCQHLLTSNTPIFAQFFLPVAVFVALSRSHSALAASFWHPLQISKFRVIPITSPRSKVRTGSRCLTGKPSYVRDCFLAQSICFHAYPTQARHRKFSLFASSPSKAASPTPGSPAVLSIRVDSPSDSELTDVQLQLLSFYRFIPISDPDSVRDALFGRLKNIPGLRGTVYVAEEGVNAQFAVPVGKPLEHLLQTFGKSSAAHKSHGQEKPERESGGCLPFDMFENNPPNMGDVVNSSVPTFERLIVRTRDCILRDGMLSKHHNNASHDNGNESALDWNDAGVELDPSEWDAQLRPLLLTSPPPNDSITTVSTTTASTKPNIQLLDCRNDYESAQGTFLSSTPLDTQTFSETWSILDSQVESKSLDPSEPVYIFCTGGIRCVKVGAYLKQKFGFHDVRSLRHGIIGYERWWKNSQDCDIRKDNSEQKNSKDALWVGDNFLFDKRRFSKEDDDNSTD